MISCPANDLINLYYSNGTYTVNSLTTSPNPMYVGFDSKGRYVLISKNQISIYH